MIAAVRNIQVAARRQVVHSYNYDCNCILIGIPYYYACHATYACHDCHRILDGFVDDLYHDQRMLLMAIKSLLAMQRLVQSIPYWQLIWKIRFFVLTFSY